MSEKEYIERGVLIAEYDRVHVGAPGGARKLMVDAPAADVVEVVRCKDCRHGNLLIQNGQEIVACTNEAPPFADYFCPPMRLYDFCSYGERKEQT